MIRSAIVALAVVLFAAVTGSTARADEKALAEVNAKRAARGLPAFKYDPGLTQAAEACARHRAERFMFGHAMDHPLGDFRFLPPGVSADSAGCAAYEDHYGWMSCCTYEGYEYAGAAWARGRDGKRYMHLFVRGGGLRGIVPGGQPPAVYQSSKSVYRESYRQRYRRR